MAPLGQRIHRRQAEGGVGRRGPLPGQI